MKSDAVTVLVDALSTAKDVVEMQSAMHRFIQKIGFETFAHVIVSLPQSKLEGHFRSSTFPQQWVDHYRSNQFAAIDPIFPRSQTEILPFRWEGIISDGRSSQRQKEIFRNANDFGLRQGITIPIHGAGTERGLLSVTSDLQKRDEFEKRYVEFRSQLMFGAYCYHNSMRTVLGSPNDRISLAPREMEVLTWAAKGKTAWETGEILGITERTVNFHLRNAINKLSVTNTRQAVVRAIMLGLVFL